MLDFIQNHQAKLAVAAVIAVVATATLIPKFMSTKKAPAFNPDVLPALTEEETLRIIAKILEKLKMQAARMVSAAENIRAQIEAQGQQIDDEKLMKHFILPHFETAMLEVQEKVYEEYDVDEGEVEDARAFYIRTGNKDIKEAYDKIKTIHKEFGGDVEVEEEEDDGLDVDGQPLRELTVQDVVAILETLAERMGEVTDNYVEEFIHEHGIPHNNSTITAFQEGMMGLSEDMEKEVLDEQGISMTLFQKSVKRHQASPMITQTIMKMQMENQMRLQSHGIPMGGF
jgi:hypothetical protein